jgi:hypothetical protein
VNSNALSRGWAPGISPCDGVTEGETKGPLTDASIEWWATNALEAWAGGSDATTEGGAAVV